MQFKSRAELLKYAEEHKQLRRVAVVQAENEHTLQAVVRARSKGYVEPWLIGDRHKIMSIAEQDGLDIAENLIIDAPDDVTSAARSVELIREGKADFLMKGNLNTSVLLRAVLNKQTGIPNSGLVTTMTFVEVPWYHKMFVMSDAAILVYPTLEQKVKQIKLLTEAMKRIGYGDDINVAAVCANENVSPKIAETVEAAELKRMNLEGEITGCRVEGPISIDLAMSKSAAEIKGYDSPVAGEADILLFPNLLAGNVFAKAISLSGGVSQGIVIGADVPIAITSRSGSVENKYNSLLISSTLVKQSV